MDKKMLVSLVEEIVASVAAKNALEEVEARTLVGIALKKNKEAFVNSVVIPNLGGLSTNSAN